MSKRCAERILTKDNCEDDEPEEKSGVFERASEEVLAKRVIRKAKRAGPADEEKKSNAFSGFSFFGNGNAAPPAQPAWGKPTPTVNSPSNTGNGASDEFFSKVAKLNKDILSCISRLLDKEAYLNLTPCFEDYMKHFQRLSKEAEERQRNNNNNSNNGLTTSSSTQSPTAQSPPKTSFVFGASTAPTGFKNSANTDSPSFFKFDSTTSAPALPSGLASSSPPSTTGFKFGVSASASKETSPTSEGTPAKISAFGQPPASTALGGGFTFGSHNVVPLQTPVGVTNTGGNEEEDDVPPKVDVKPVEEDDSLYTKKVKLFYKKPKPTDGNLYAEKGIGFLHIKQLEGSDSGYQLLVRAQTTLGNVLLNIRLGKDLPVQRVGKNNVGFFCVPNPPLHPGDKEAKEPVMFLIRAKTSDDADELRDKLVEFQKKV